MTHTRQYHESEGRFSAERQCSRPCAGTCKKNTEHKALTWESNCGSYEDYKFTCLTCGAVHWVDGDDG